MFNHFAPKRWLRCITAAAITLFLSTSVFAQAKPQLAGVRIDAHDRVELTHTIPTPLLTAADLGRISSSAPMKDMMLLLQPTKSQKAALETFLADVQNPASPNFHKWLTPAQFGKAYGPAQSDVDAVTQWLSSQGFTVEQVSTSHTWIRFSGVASTVESSFGTEIHTYNYDGHTVYSNSKEITLPRALATVVSSVLSLNNFEKHALHVTPRAVTRTASGKLVAAPRVASGLASAQANAVNPSFTSQGQPEENLLAPGDFSKIYDTASLVSAGTDGTGVSIAIVGRSDISLSDVESFRTVFALPFNDPTIINANDDPGVVPGDDEEAILDVEWSGAVAPHAQIKYVIGSTTATTDGVDISAAYIVDNRVAPIMSVSFGLCEQAVAPAEQQFYNNLWQQASAEGISVLISSGDAGASECVVPDEYLATNYGFGVNGLASTPYNTAVGGTEFSDIVPDTYWNQTINPDQSSAKGYIPEATWNESCNPAAPVSIFNCYFDQTYENTYAGAGGASTCSTHSATASILTGLYTCTSGYMKPSWQTGTGVPSDNARDLPDLALAAAAEHDGFMLCYDGSCQWETQPNGSIVLESATIIGGTSAASPSMAGILALVEQKNGQYQGLINPKLYALSASQTGSCNSSAQSDPTQTTSCVFHDVTAGSNTLTCTGTSAGCTIAIPGTTYKQLSGWSATTGYDLSTGLGTVDAANLVSAWGNLTQTATTTTLALSSTTFTHGTPVTVTATTSPTSGTGTPTGSIDLTATGNTSNPGPVIAENLTGGTYTGPIASLPGGTYQLTAQYGGDATFASSTSSPVSVTIAPESTVMTASTLVYSRFIVLGRDPLVSGTSSPLNKSYFISVQLAGASCAGIPTGTVTITQGANNQPVGTYTVDKTGLVYVTCGPSTSCDYPLGSYTFNISYSGDSSFKASTTTLPFTITKGTAEWSVSASAQVVSTGTTVVATVYFGYDPAALPTGTVTLFRTDTNATLGTAPIGSDGTAVITFSAPAGSYGAEASWAGDANYTAGFDSSYPDMTVTNAGGNTTTTTMAVAHPSSSLGASTSFSVTVAPTVTTTSLPSGTVTLYSQQYGQISNPVNIVGGAATLFVQWPIAGNLSIYAVYSGDTNFGGSSSALSSVTITKATPTIPLTSVAPFVSVGGQASITASVISTLSSTAASAPTGTIQFYDSLNGGTATMIGNPQAINTSNASSLVATIAPVLAAGTHSISAIYSGDTNWNAAPSAASVSIVATTPDFSVTGPASLTVTAGRAVSLALNTTSILGYTTPATLSCGTLPEGVSCNTATVTPGAAATLTLTTVAPGDLPLASVTPHHLPWQLPGAVAFAGMIFLLFPRRKKLASLAVLLVCTAVIGVNLSGCASNNSPVDSSLGLSSSDTKVANGTAVTLTATIGSTHNPTGTVTFYDAGTSIGTGTVSGGVATLSSSTLTVGTHAITATYSGDDNNSTSKSSVVLEQTVTGNFTLSVVATSGSLSHTATIPVTLQ